MNRRSFIKIIGFFSGAVAFKPSILIDLDSLKVVGPIPNVPLRPKSVIDQLQSYQDIYNEWVGIAAGSLAKKIDDDIVDEVIRAQDDFEYFCEKFVNIELTETQKEIIKKSKSMKIKQTIWANPQSK